MCIIQWEFNVCMQAFHYLIINIQYELNPVCHETSQHCFSSVGAAAYLEQTSQACRLAVDTDSEHFDSVWDLCLFSNLQTRDDNSTAYLTGLLGELNRLTHVRNASNSAWHRVRAQRVPTIIIGGKTHLRRLLKSLNNVLDGSLYARVTVDKMKVQICSHCSLTWEPNGKGRGNKIIAK